MSATYQAVTWNHPKKLYDAVIASGAFLYLGVFIGVGTLVHPSATAETLIIRGFGTLALLLLHVILCIGPLCRLHPRFLPLLYNRRHLGVTMFFAALVHGVFSLVQFHALGDASLLVSLLVSNTRYANVSQFPFETLGLAALVILFLMAATSHDFWLHLFGPVAWKRLHMLVYAAYALLIAHVALGALQSETSPVLAGALGAGMITVIALHIAAGATERSVDQKAAAIASDGYVEVCAVHAIPEKRAKVVSAGGERIAVFRYDGKVSAIGNVCRHQGGPLGEGRIIDGCVTCPWHGYQYLPDSGASPPPFTEKVSTFRTRVVNGTVFVHPCALPPETRVEPSSVESLMNLI